MALNEMQKKAVETTEGPLLILAGAGSGKTTVLVNRVQHIIEDGYADVYKRQLMYGMDKMFSEVLGIEAKVVKDPQECVRCV